MLQDPPPHSVLKPAVEDALVRAVQHALPAVFALYAFGSQVQSTVSVQSDLDLAVFGPGYADPLLLWELSGVLADIACCPVDLLDLRAASTVMQYQIITTGRCLWSRGVDSRLFESFVLSEKTGLDTARAGLLSDIQREGHVYGR